jgi:hypothetical protein
MVAVVAIAGPAFWSSGWITAEAFYLRFKRGSATRFPEFLTGVQETAVFYVDGQ